MVDPSASAALPVAAAFRRQVDLQFHDVTSRYTASKPGDVPEERLMTAGDYDMSIRSCRQVTTAFVMWSRQLMHNIRCWHFIYNASSLFISAVAVVHHESAAYKSTH